jgi:GGDEF domain-containing protein
MAARLLQAWLVGAEPTLVEPATAVLWNHETAFIDRIDEEVERARRFDLGLALVFIDAPIEASSGDTPSPTETVRRELRRSDVLQAMGTKRIAVLLTHTDAAATARVVARLRVRLAGAESGWNTGSFTMGHAVFSLACDSAEALVAQASHGMATSNVTA